MKKAVGILTILLFLSGCGGDDGFTFEEQLAIDIALIDSYLDENGISTEVHGSGIRFNETEQGSNRTPGIGDVAVAKFSYSVLGRDEIIGAADYGDSFTMNNGLMRALYFMLLEMQEGGKMTFYAPSGYCFGPRSNELIPANSNLVFDLELVSVVRNESEQFAADTTIIETYLESNEIDALVHESGIRFTVEFGGIGESPTSDSQVTVAYQGRFLNGSVFDESEDGVTFGLKGLIEAWQIMIPTMKSQGKITIYAPSGLCYGEPGSLDAFGNVIIPTNSILVFDMELLEIN